MREKKYPAEHLGGKKISCPPRLLEKKKLADQKSPPPPQKLNGRPLVNNVFTKRAQNTSFLFTVQK